MINATQYVRKLPHISLSSRNPSNFFLFVRIPVILGVFLWPISKYQAGAMFVGGKWPASCVCVCVSDFWFPLLSLDNKEGTSTVLGVRNLIMYWFLFRYTEQSITFPFVICLFRQVSCMYAMLSDDTFRTLYVRLNIKFSIPRTRLKSTCLTEILRFLALSLLYELDKLFSVNISFSISRRPYFVFMPT